MGWEKFETDCAAYLQNTFGEYADFELRGGSNSNDSDIAVKTKSGNNFNIEVKSASAQCGQFVLFPNDERKCFEYSSVKLFQKTGASNEIVDYMNRNFYEYCDLESGSKNIDMPSYVFAECIIDIYKRKNTKFIITGSNTILFLEDIEDYFDITACYRVKRSGSHPVGKTKANDIIDYIQNNYNVTSAEPTDDGRVFVISNQNLNNVNFGIGDPFVYQFADKGGKYEVRKLGNTASPTVIFKIKQKRQGGLSDTEFISYLM